MHSVEHYRRHFLEYLDEQRILRTPENLYEPIDYILRLPGKRIRPLLTLMSADIFGSDYAKALPAAMAMEVFHNFSLVHDDIMDDAPLRRGNETVHEKWGLNTGILSGDAMLILAYQYFEQYEPTVFRSLAQLFSKTALEVCEGQQSDVDFEIRSDVTIAEYLKMIEYKTAVLVAAALKMGAIIAGTSSENCDAIYEFGRNLGIAFQIQDDYLDVYGNPETFGKQTGGDIIENKKTYLYLQAVALASPNQASELDHLYSIQPSDNSDKIASVRQLFNDTGASTATLEAIQKFTIDAFTTLDKIAIADDKKIMLRAFGENLMRRQV
ncbi:MAG: polyprenyl synthetase family protein [Flavobacterium sp.]|nr:polyprenyl synthetase family protein [Flavobacterium sp.]